MVSSVSGMLNPHAIFFLELNLVSQMNVGSLKSSKLSDQDM